MILGRRQSVLDLWKPIFGFCKANWALTVDFRLLGSVSPFHLTGSPGWASISRCWTLGVDFGPL